jgi:hypothetical protein
MRWDRVPIVLRLICVALAVGSFAVAWRLRQMSVAGIEDVPPPFILLTVLAGIGFLCIAVIGRYPRPRA